MCSSSRRQVYSLLCATFVAGCSSQIQAPPPAPTYAPGPSGGKIVALQRLDYHKGLGPTGALTWRDGAFWGSTSNGGINIFGVIFKFVPGSNGSWHYHKIKAVGSKSTGTLPAGNLTYFPATGLLYGATLSNFIGSQTGPGFLFSVNPKSGKYAVVYKFKGGKNDGFTPTGNLTLFQPPGGGKALLYGTTAAGGPANYGTLFSFNPSTGKEQVVHTFGGSGDGAQPSGGLAIVGNTIYGTTYYGGASNAGTIYSFTPSSNAENVLYSFTGGSDGGVPIGGVSSIVSSAANVLFGAASADGANGGGTFFQYDLGGGGFSVLHQFGSISGDGTYSLSAPYVACSPGTVVLANCVLYGNTARGGGNGLGTLFQVSPLGFYATLASFNGANGAQPVGGVSLYKNGLIGTAYGRGTGQYITDSTIYYYALPIVGALRRQ